MPEIEKITRIPGDNPLIMQKIGGNLKSLDLFEEVFTMNFWKILIAETNRHVEQKIKK